MDDDKPFRPGVMLDFMVDFATSKAENSKEYVDTIFYFKDLKTEAGVPVFQNDQGFFGEYQYNAVKYILGVNPSSVEASNFQMLLDLVVDGIVDKHVFRDLPKEGKIAKPVVDDIDKLYEASKAGVKVMIFCRGICSMKPINA